MDCVYKNDVYMKSVYSSIKPVIQIGFVLQGKVAREAIYSFICIPTVITITTYRYFSLQSCNKDHRVQDKSFIMLYIEILVCRVFANRITNSIAYSVDCKLISVLFLTNHFNY